MSHGLSLSLRARRVFLLGSLPVLLALGSPGSAWSQAGAAESTATRPGPGKRAGHHGPIAPAVLRDSIGVTGSKLEQYTRLYDSHMAATKPARDSLRSAVQVLRSGPRDGDRSAARERRGALRERFQELAKRDQQFESSLKNLLTQDQQKRYADWKENQRSMARQRWHRGHDRNGDESRPRG